MGYRYYICDVFTTMRFGGNQLAVLPNADGLSARQMQLIAREFNFSESTFVFPSEAGHTRRVVGTWVGGASVLVSEGVIEVG
jgi:trans-2,3-dihydro-3-hydroxyanthranilate isomerase